MTLKQLDEQGYVLCDGEILSVYFDKYDSNIVKIKLAIRQNLNKNKYRKCNLLMTLNQIVKVDWLDMDTILGNYSDITILSLENGNYYVSLDPFGNDNKPNENDNDVFISKHLVFEEV